MATRRGLVKGLALLSGAGVVVAQPWSWLAPPRLDYAPMRDRRPFRRLLTAGATSGAGSGVDAALVGLNPAAEVDPVLLSTTERDLTALLWGDWQGDGPVPVNYFTDIRCPMCRLLEPRLAALENIHLTTREYPIFGEASERAARAILSASEQGRGEEMRARLMGRRARIASDADLVPIASALGLDVERFRADLTGEGVAHRLAQDRALARLFGIPGTPALIIGRTYVLGLQSSALLDAVVAAERT